MDKPSVETKWNDIWSKNPPYKFDKNNVKNKHYVLEMFSYPSGAKLHVGHWYNYGLSDSYARFCVLKGKNVYEPMGFDAFGLPAENYAIQTGIHPKDSTEKNVEIMEQQLKKMCALFDWDSEVKTCAPDYYKWTQWLFCQLYKNGLAYRKKAPVNWCPHCQTVLANEQVQDGKCDRCHSDVTRKDLTQWFFKITQYAEELLEGLDKLDWPEKTKIMQQNWIGKSTGGEIEFKLVGCDKSFRVFTTRADTLFGCTYVILAPEHPLVDEITTAKYKKGVAEYREQTAKTNEIERLSTAKEKTGVFTGAYAINPVNGDKVEVWIGDYVLYSYGTGAVMAVPAHDERDFIFAKKHSLKIKRVILPKNAQKEYVGEEGLPFCEYGVLMDSAEFSGTDSETAKVKIVEKLSKKGLGELKTNYRLRDWLVSRQRYWGAPIPVVYCDKCGTVLDERLPIELPYDVDFTPDGTSPLKRHEGFMHTTCPVCHGKALRECDTLDTFVCSSWYYLRYPDSKNKNAPFDKEWIDKMLPVDKYIGGVEHACMHLLYARFITKALRDMGYLSFDEPFKSLVHQGTILGEDGNKMSKSLGNTVSPDEYIEKFGSDVLRTYMAFGFKYIEGGPWSEEGLVAVNKWLDRTERQVELAFSDYPATENFGKDEQELNRVRHNTITSVEKDFEEFSFNTAVARMMELVNAMTKYSECKSKNKELYQNTAKDLLIILSPLAPHFCQELWKKYGFSGDVMTQKYPDFDKNALHTQTVELLVQFNSRPKTRIDVDSSATAKEIEKIVLSDKKVIELLNGATVKKVIVIPNRLVNILI